MCKELLAYRRRKVTGTSWEIGVLLFWVLLLLNTSFSFAEDGFDRYGGWEKLKGEANGFFHSENINGQWWLVTPEGNVFLSIGVNIVRFEGDYAPKLGFSPYQKNVSRKYRSEDEWQRETLRRLGTWGFNTIGSWSSRFKIPELNKPYVIQLNLGSTGSTDWRKRSFPDVFNPEFEKKMYAGMASKCNGTFVSDPYLIGYLLDNEIFWGIDIINKTASYQSGKTALINFLKQKYKGDFSTFALVWNIKKAKSFDEIETILNEFQTMVRNKQIKPILEGRPPAVDDVSEMLRFIANRFFSVTTQAIRSCDKNHLILGIRFLAETPTVVVEECGKFSDIISVNYYPVPDKSGNVQRYAAQSPSRKKLLGFVYPDNWLKDYYRISGKPVLVTETSFRARGDGFPDDVMAMSSQKDRPEAFEWFLKNIAANPYIVGYHWFQYMDQPKSGREDGERNNFGIVDIEDNPYPLLVDRMKILNREAYTIHASGK